MQTRWGSQGPTHFASVRFYVIRLYVGLLGAGMSFAALGATVTQSHFPPNPGLMPGGGWTWSGNSTFADPPPPRQWTNGTYGGVRGVTALDTWTLNGRAGALPVQRSIFTPLAAVGRTVAQCMGNFACAVVSGVVVASLPAAMDRLRVYRDPLDLSIKFDPGADPDSGTATAYRWTGENMFGFNGGAPYLPENQGSPTAACQDLAADFNAWFRAQGQTYDRLTGAYHEGGPNSGDCRATFVDDSPPSSTPGWLIGQWATNGTMSTTSCPASVDPFNPAYSVPAGQPVGVDGKCQTARYNWAPITPTAVGTRLENYPPPAASSSEADTLQAFRDALLRGETAPGSTSLPMSGPASQNGTPQVTNTVPPGGGSPTTTTTTTTYNYTYNDNDVTYVISTTTVNGSGTTTTTGGDVEVCGLPGGAPCKIDETGTPTQSQMSAARQQLDTAADQLRAKVEEQSEPRALPWLWGGITLPAGACTNLVAPSPHESIPDGVIDLCGQPWVAWWRAAWAVFCGIWCAAYCWRRFSDTVEGSAA